MSYSARVTGNLRSQQTYYTFMEQYDFSGKTVLPFATSGMSGIGDSGNNMQALAPGAKLEEGKRFPARTSAKELADWASRWM